MALSDRPILITGAHRTGSTFVGRILSMPAELGYIQEPFNRKWGIVGNDDTFPYVRAGSDQEAHYRALVEDLLALRATYKNPWQKSSSPLRAAGNRLIGGRHGFLYRLLRFDPRVKRLLIKDPIACMSAEWMHQAFGMQVLVLVRHPAAFVASLRRMDWSFDLHRLIAKRDLYEEHLSGILDPSVDYSELSLVEEAALLWQCIYTVLTTYIDRNPEMIVRTHEDISREPVEHLRQLYELLDLPFTKAVQREIERTTGSDNPVDPERGKTHSMLRDSRQNTRRWRKLLKPDEVERIRAITGDLAGRFYSDEDW